MQDVDILPDVDMEKPKSQLPSKDSVEIPTTHMFSACRLRSGITQSSARYESEKGSEKSKHFPDVNRNKTYISASIHDRKEIPTAMPKFSRSDFSMDISD